ncbi:dynamin family protein [Dactylosporangium sp. AC04546]|uniref:dynamin family protein n=1 Tax=Dactylosporangium sp. AC04546 TaxID=2862460 RepID=UPI001EDCD2BB|nr:dynamin family protein [Dactylosporangium sp. AC04546]WVK87006.1 dynamin family protein [Dactylosporangium sp. AC04546]
MEDLASSLVWYARELLTWAVDGSHGIAGLSSARQRSTTRALAWVDKADALLATAPGRVPTHQRAPWLRRSQLAFRRDLRTGLPEPAALVLGLRTVDDYLTDRISTAEATVERLNVTTVRLTEITQAALPEGEVVAKLADAFRTVSLTLQVRGGDALSQLDSRVFTASGGDNGPAERWSARLHRDRWRVFRDLPRAATYATRFVSGVAGTAQHHARDAVAELQSYLRHSVEQMHADHANTMAVEAFRPALYYQRPPAPPSLPNPSDIRVRTKGVAAAVAAAATSVVLPAGLRPPHLVPGRFRRLLTAHQLRPDAARAWRSSAYVVDRVLVTAQAESAWRSTYEALVRDARRGLDHHRGNSLRPFFALRDSYLAQWRQTLREEIRLWSEQLTQLRERRQQLETCRAQLNVVTGMLASWSRSRPGEVAGLLRVAAADAATFLRGYETQEHGDLLSDLDRVAAGEAELCIAVLAPMKAGKSTLINAMVGADILPSRSTAMTGLATRVVLGGVDAVALRAADTQLAALRRIERAVRHLLKTREGMAVVQAQPQLDSAVAALHNGPLWSAAAVGAAAVRERLVAVNDLLRLALLLGLEVTEALRSPLEVILPAAWPGPTTAVFIDTPGPDEIGSTDAFSAIVASQTRRAHIIFVVADYTKVGSEAAFAVSELVDPALEVLGRDALWVLLNRADQRNSQAELAEVRGRVGYLYDIAPADQDQRVIPVSARYAVLAQNYRRALASGQDPAPAGEELARTYAPAGWQRFARSSEELASIADEMLAESRLPEFQSQQLARLQAEAGLLAARAVLRRSAWLLTSIAGPQPVRHIEELVEAISWSIATVSAEHPR